MVDEQKHIFDKTSWQPLTKVSHNESLHIIEIVKITARSAAEADFKAGLEQRVFSKIDKKTNE